MLQIIDIILFVLI